MYQLPLSNLAIFAQAFSPRAGLQDLVMVLGGVGRKSRDALKGLF